jgi:hypothetical protein
MPMPMRAPDLTDEEIAAIVALLRRLLNNESAHVLAAIRAAQIGIGEARPEAGKVARRATADRADNAEPQEAAALILDCSLV